jgi:radical SAM protein with 4Fe4S-binding SPASM domain
MDKTLYTQSLHTIKKGDVTIFIDPETPNWAAVNGHGASVLELCDGRKTAREIAEHLTSSYSKDDVHRFIKEAIKCEIIGTNPLPSPSYQGRAAYLTPEELEELWVYVTNRCNLRCKHCLVRGGEVSKEELTVEKFKETLKDAVGLGTKRFFFTGGEPFLRDDIFELIRYVTDELKIELVILTNGTLFDEGTVKRLARFPRLVIQVSLEGPTAETNDPIRGKGAHRKSLKGIGLLRSHGLRTIVTSTATRKNISEIPTLSDLLHKKDVKTHHVLWVHKRGRAATNPVTVDTEKLAHLMMDLKKKSIKVDNWESFKARVYGKRGTKVDGCHAVYSSLCVDSNGDVYPCPSLNGDPKFIMGNIKDGLEKVWLSSGTAEWFRNLSVIHIEGCRACEFRFFCGGGCRCQAYFGSEKPNILAKDPYCELIKEMLVESMLDFVSPNGQERPEFLGYMQESTASCDCGSDATKEVAPFHCTCVLDVAAHKNVVARYGTAANQPEENLCCPTGYTETDFENLPKGTIGISYGCGNPTAFGGLTEGESVLDIGAGGGIDCFIAAKKVGSSGKVIGVDMTDEMLEKANKNKEKMAALLGYDIVEFRKGLAEELPVESSSVDLVISNCVINLSPDKKRVFEEIYRVVKNGGRFSISDIVSDKEVPEEMKQNEKLWSGCVSGALPKDVFLSVIKDAGFADLVVEKSSEWKEVEGIGFYSVTIKGRKI